MDSEQRGYRKERPLADIIPPDRRRQRAAALVFGGMVAGAALFAFVEWLTKPGPTVHTVVHERATNVRTFAIGTATADITSKRSGAVASDGEPDQSFDLVIDGTVDAIVIASVDSTGRRYGTTRWGTNDYDPAVSIGFALVPPKTAWQLAVLEDGQPRNDANGALIPLAEGTHRLRVYASDNGTFEPASYFRVYVIDSRGGITASDPLAFTGHGPANVRPKPVVPPSEQQPASPAFDRASAAASLGAVNVQRCASQPGVFGAGHVTVVFANDGTVSHAEVDHGGNEGTARGACIARAFGAAKVPPFAGAPVRVGKSFTVEPSSARAQ